MNVLIVKTSSLGDIIHTFPVVDFLKNHFPESKISWVVEKSFAELLHRHPDVDQVIEVDTKKWRRTILLKETWKEISEARALLKQQTYDIVFDLQGNMKSGIVLSWVKAHRKIGFGKNTVAEWPNTLFTTEKFNPPEGNNIREDYLYIVQKGLGVEGDFTARPIQLVISEEEKQLIEPYLEKSILICPGSRWENKRVSLETMKEFLRLVDSQCLFSWGSDEELKVCEELSQGNGVVLPKMGIAALQYLMTHVKLVIAMDSLPLHLAGTTNTRTVGVFGPSSAKKYAPIGQHHHYIQGTCPYSQSFKKRCPILRKCETGACIKNITAQQLLEVVKGK